MATKLANSLSCLDKGKFLITAATALVQDEITVSGSAVCYAVTPAASGATTMAVYEDDRVEMPAETGVAFVAGDKVYWDPAAGVLTKTAGSLKCAGMVLEPKTSAATTAVIDLSPEWN